MPLFLEKVQLSGKAAGIEISPVTVRNPDELEGAFATIQKDGAGALVMQGSLPSRTVAELALKQRLPAGTFTRSFPEVGGLMSYGPNATDSFQRGVYFVIKVLQGGKPAELNRRNSNSSSILRLRRRLASPCLRACSPAPTK
jgi:putative ABC transport system substrate-binding protein